MKRNKINTEEFIKLAKEGKFNNPKIAYEVEGDVKLEGVFEHKLILIDFIFNGDFKAINALFKESFIIENALFKESFEIMANFQKVFDVTNACFNGKKQILGSSFALIWNGKLLKEKQI